MLLHVVDPEGRREAQVTFIAMAEAYVLEAPNLATDGIDVLWDFSRTEGGLGLMEGHTGHLVMREIVEDYLKYPGRGKQAERWRGSPGGGIQAGTRARLPAPGQALVVELVHLVEVNLAAIIGCGPASRPGLGSAHDDTELEKLKAAAQQWLAACQGELEVGPERTKPTRRDVDGGVPFAARIGCCWCWSSSCCPYASTPAGNVYGPRIRWRRGGTSR